LPEHTSDRAIDVRVDYAAACERLSEFAGDTRRRWRLVNVGLGSWMSLLLGCAGGHDFDELFDLLLRHSLLIGFLVERKERLRPCSRLLHVQAARDELRAVRRAPIRRHKSAEPVLAAQDALERFLVAARVDAADPVVRAHHGGDTGIDDGFERS